MVRNEPLSATSFLLTIKRAPNESRLFSFQPGQYAAIGFKKGIRPTAARCFSIASSPTDQSILKFGIRIKGKFTQSLSRLPPGHEVTVRGPFGGFVYDAERDQDTILLAGGIGISPFIGMVEFASDTGAQNPMQLLYSCHGQDDVPFAPYIKELENRNPRFSSTLFIGKGPTDSLAHRQVVTGHITADVLDRVTANRYSGKTFFICGPTPFMNAMVQLLRDKNVREDRIMTEAFGQGSNRQTGKIRSWPINVYSLGAVGLAAGSFAIMISDLIKTLPPSKVLDPSNTARQSTLTSNRQTDLDSLVNDLPSVESPNPSSTAVVEAERQMVAAQPTTTPTNSQPTTTSSKPASPTPSSTPASTAQPVTQTVTAAPAPAPTPKCTTTQSGITTCQ